MVDELPKQTWSSQVARASYHHQSRGTCTTWNQEHRRCSTSILSSTVLKPFEELDIELREDFLEMGGEELTVVKCLNDDDQWIDGLESLVRKRLDAITA